MSPFTSPRGGGESPRGGSRHPACDHAREHFVRLRQGPFAGHGQRGPHGHGFGPFGRAKRGNVRAAVLTLLAEEPMHGYQIMQQLEERSGGFWRPSPGSVYPTLQLLEDQGLLKGEEVEGKRVFSLTDAGRAEAATIKEQRPGGAPWETGASGDDPRFKLRRAVFQLGAAVKQVGTGGTPAQVDEALQILAEARKRIYALLAAGD
jgi:DNA-binding PadR family transcriptional regulator